MRATLNIPDELISKVQKISGEKSKTKAVIVAIKEYIKQRKIDDLLRLRGKVKIDYNWEEEEKKELESQKERESLCEEDK